MLLKHLLCSLACASIVVAASIPQHRVQQPLLPEHQPSRSEPQNINFLLAFIEIGSNMQKLAEIPLNTRVVSGLSLPSRLSAIKIAMAVTIEDRSISLERLDKIMCRITAKTKSEDERAMKGKGSSEDLPWFMLRDGTVQLEDSSSEWFLEGRAIESFECR